MSGLKVLLLLISLFMLSSCVKGNEAGSVTLAIDSGILICPTHSFEMDELILFKVFNGQIERSFQISTQPVFPINEILTFENIPEFMIEPLHSYGFFSGVFVQEGDFVYKGDVLAEIFLEHSDELFEIELFDLKNERNHFVASFESARLTLLMEIDRIRTDLIFANEADARVLELRLKRMELQLEVFEEESQISLDNIDYRISKHIEQKNKLRIYAPFDGVITFINSTPAGTMWRDVTHISPAGQRGIIQIINHESIFFTANSNIDTLRFGDIVTIREHAGLFEFNARVASDPLASPVSRSGNFDFILVPVNLKIFDDELFRYGYERIDLINIPLHVFPSVTLADNGIIGHRLAVHQENHRNFVFVYKEGNIRKRYVEIGVSFGNYVQILAGVKPGQLLVMS